MTISREDFMSGNFAVRAKTHKITQRDILRSFLKKNRIRGYRVDELKKILKMNEDTLRCNLRYFVIQKKILHSKPYFIYKR